MPREWSDRHAVNQMEDEEQQRFYRSIVADKKPYFMRYIYPALMTEYRNYMRKSDAAALREFRMTVEDLRALPYHDLSDRQKEFLHYYELGIPVGMGDCVLNRICRRIEAEFDGFVGRVSADTAFDTELYKAGASYSQSLYYAVKKLYDEYRTRRQEYTVYAKVNAVDGDEAKFSTGIMFEEFRKECLRLCSNAEILTDILVDLWYRTKTTNALLWHAFPGELIRVLAQKNGGVICVPVRDDNGEIEFRGERYTIQTKELEGFDGDYSERAGVDAEGACGERAWEERI